MAAAAPTPLQGILNLPRLEQLFGQLMARLAHQETEIAALQTAARHNATLEARCAGLEAQLARLEAATSLDAESINQDETASEATAPSSVPHQPHQPHQLQKNSQYRQHARNIRPGRGLVYLAIMAKKYCHRMTLRPRALDMCR